MQIIINKLKAANLNIASITKNAIKLIAKKYFLFSAI